MTEESESRVQRQEPRYLLRLGLIMAGALLVPVVLVATVIGIHEWLIPALPDSLRWLFAPCTTPPCGAMPLGVILVLMVVIGTILFAGMRVIHYVR